MTVDLVTLFLFSHGKGEKMEKTVCSAYSSLHVVLLNQSFKLLNSVLKDSLEENILVANLAKKLFDSFSLA